MRQPVLYRAMLIALSHELMACAGLQQALMQSLPSSDIRQARTSRLDSLLPGREERGFLYQLCKACWDV